MRSLGTRTQSLAVVLAAAAALAVALISEHWAGLVPCALCLLERWPYRIAIILGLIASFLPRPVSRLGLWLVVLTMTVSVALAAIHVGVEQGLWPSPLPECAAPKISGNITQMLRAMPTRPAKPCDSPTFLIPGLPLSMAAMNLIYSLVFAALLAISLLRTARRTA